jgi:hypothetical protein
MELDLQSLFGLHVYSCTQGVYKWLYPLSETPQLPPPPIPLIWAHIRGVRYWPAKIDDVSLGLPELKLTL